MTDGEIEVLEAVAKLMQCSATRDDAALVVKAIARGAQGASQAKELRDLVSRLRHDLGDMDRNLRHRQNEERDQRSARRAALGDGVINLACGARLLIEEGRPKQIHDGAPPEDARDERRKLALEQASAIWGEELDGRGPWSDDGAVDVEEAIPF